MRLISPAPVILVAISTSHKSPTPQKSLHVHRVTRNVIQTFHSINRHNIDTASSFSQFNSKLVRCLCKMPRLRIQIIPQLSITPTLSNTQKNRKKRRRKTAPSLHSHPHLPPLCSSSFLPFFNLSFSSFLSLHPFFLLFIPNRFIFSKELGGTYISDFFIMRAVLWRMSKKKVMMDLVGVGVWIGDSEGVVLERA